MKLCLICNYPITDKRRVKTCGELCSREWSRAYQRKYHHDHLEARREVHRNYNRRRYELDPDRFRKRPRAPLTESQKAKRRERDRKRRATADWKLKKRLERQSLSPEKRQKLLEQKRSHRIRHAPALSFKQRDRYLRNPKVRDEYSKKYARRNQLAYSVLKSLGIEIDLKTLEVKHVADCR